MPGKHVFSRIFQNVPETFDRAEYSRTNTTIYTETFERLGICYESVRTMFMEQGGKKTSVVTTVPHRQHCHE